MFNQKEYYKKWYQKNKKKIKKYIKKYEREKRKIDINYRILHNLRTRLNYALKNNSKSKATLKLLGCSITQLKLYLEEQFTKGMNWDNYERYGWHVDHIIPCAKFDLSKKSEQEKCFHYTNFQPLVVKDNRSKGSRLLKEM